MLSSRSIGIYCVLIVAAIGSSWLLEVLIPKEESADRKGAGKVDYYSKNLLRTVMDEQGKPKQLLYAERTAHYEQDDHTELERPVLTIYSQKGPPWVIHADRGLVSADGVDVFLEGSVLILREADEHGRTVKALTDNVHVRPDDHYAETEDFVQVFSPPDELSGIGMQVHFGDALRVTILSQVRRIHEMH